VFSFSSTVQNTLPPVLTVTSTDTVICAGETTSLTCSGASNYVWTLNGSPIAAGATVNVTPSVTSTYTVTGADAVGCTSSKAISVTLSNCSSVMVVSISGDDKICVGECSEITASVSGGTPPYTFDWAPNIGTVQGPYTVCPTTTTTYFLDVTDANGATKSKSFTVTVNALPQVIIKPIEPVCIGGDVKLSATGAASFVWNTEAEGQIGILPELTFKVNETTQVLVTGTDENGCSAIDSVNVEVDTDCGDVFVPNAFSPNNDGQNDFLQVYGPKITTMTFRMYDRWGNMVFEASDPGMKWDGIYNGKMMDPAVFVYHLEATLITGDRIKKKGNVSLIR
jgi:gliding motility-associated-like protein